MTTLAIEFRKGDLESHTWLDALVNPVDTELQVITGVPRALVDAAGGDIEHAMSEKKPLALGAVAHTPPGSLQAKYLFHAAVTGYREEDLAQEFWDDTLSSPAIIRAAVKNSIALAESLGCETVGFPSLAVDVTGFPAELCARAMLEGVFEYLRENAPTRLVVAVIVLDRATLPVFERVRSELAKDEQAARDDHAQLAREKLARTDDERTARDRAEREKLARETAERERWAREAAALEAADREHRAQQERAAREAAEQAALEAAERERLVRENQARRAMRSTVIDAATTPKAERAFAKTMLVRDDGDKPAPAPTWDDETNVLIDAPIVPPAPAVPPRPKSK